MRASDLLSSRLIANGTVERVTTQAQRFRDHERRHGDPYDHLLGPALERLRHRSDWNGLPRQAKRDRAAAALHDRARREQLEAEAGAGAGAGVDEDEAEAQAILRAVREDPGGYDVDEDPTMSLGAFEQAAELVAAAPNVDSETIAGWNEAILRGEIPATQAQAQDLQEAWVKATQLEAEFGIG